MVYGKSRRRLFAQGNHYVTLRKDRTGRPAEPGPAQDDVPRTLGLEVDAETDATGAYTEERYTHADGTRTIIREYRADG
jgi:hypothetical protein